MQVTQPPRGRKTQGAVSLLLVVLLSPHLEKAISVLGAGSKKEFPRKRVPLAHSTSSQLIGLERFSRLKPKGFFPVFPGQAKKEQLSLSTRGTRSVTFSGASLYRLQKSVSLVHYIGDFKLFLQWPAHNMSSLEASELSKPQIVGLNPLWTQINPLLP